LAWELNNNTLAVAVTTVAVASVRAFLIMPTS
jgi:hypothetical protein